MRFIIALLSLSLLAGCASTGTHPKKCEGEFRPVNAEQQKGAFLDASIKTALCQRSSNEYKS